MINSRQPFNPNRSLELFFRDQDWLFKTGIGGTINAVALVAALSAPVLIPGVFVLTSLVSGYALRVIRSQLINQDGKLPDWNNWIELFISGLTWIAIQCAYILLLAIVITIYLMFASASELAAIYRHQFLAWSLTSTLLIAFLWGLLNFLSPLLMVNFALEERFQAGFAVKKIISLSVRSPDFVLMWLLSIGLRLSAILLPAATLIGIFLMPSTLFIAEILSASLAAQAWKAYEPVNPPA